MSDPMQEIRASFFVECEELLEVLQDGLQALSEGDTDHETINTVFRAVHSIKGGAGAFGLTQLVSFAHKFENVLDDLRGGLTAVDGELVALLYTCADVLSDLLRTSREGHTLDARIVDPVVASLCEISAGTEHRDDAGDDLDFTPTALSLDIDDLGSLDGADDAMVDLAELPAPPHAGDSETMATQPLGHDPKAEEDRVAGVQKGHAISFSPEAGLYSGGNEPLFLIRLLEDMGHVETRVEASAALPALDELSPSDALLTWQIKLRGDVDRDSVLEVFEFAEGLCRLEISPLAEQPAQAPTSSQPELVVEAARSSGPPEATLPPANAHDTAPRVRSQPAALLPIAPEQPSPNPPPAPTKSSTVRVDLERIDRLVNLVGELVINQAMLAQSAAEAGIPSNSPVSSGLDEFQHLTRNIQESVMMIRAQPVKSLFQRMGRIVREASTATGKQARLLTEGEATEIDKTVIERLSDPLTHMVRNAVDHGLERSEARIAAGKAARGTVKLTAAHRSGRVVIEVSDDGGGINRARVQAIAVQKGLISEGQTLTDQEIDNLLFAPGFSTATEVSNLSGRGVGMDVVKNSISALGGRISIFSTPGEGTSFSISLPLTLAVLDGMVVGIEAETMVVPLNAIAETLTLSTSDIRALGPHTQVVLVRETFVPLLDLGVELGYRAPKPEYEGAIALLIVQEDGNRAALVVDKIDDQRQVVIKGLQDSYGHVPGVAAATILGDGKIALILDPVDLITNATGNSVPESALQKAG